MKNLLKMGIHLEKPLASENQIVLVGKIVECELATIASHIQYVTEV